MGDSPVGPGGLPSTLGRGGNDLFASRSYSVTKHSWKGKYRRILVFGPDGACTLNPASMEATNRWPYEDIVSVQPQSPAQSSASLDTVDGVDASHSSAASAGAAPPLELTLSFRKGGGRKTDSMRFSSEFRAKILTDALRHHAKFAEGAAQPKVSFTADFDM